MTLRALQLPYLPDSQHYIRTLADEYGLCWLDSGLQRQAHARFDIISCQPVWEIRQQRDSGGQPVLWQRIPGQTWQLMPESDLFTLCQQKLDNLTDWITIREQLNDLNLNHLPFAGGLIGALGYAATQSQRSGYRQNYSDGTDLLTAPEAWAGLYAWALIIDHQQQVANLIVLPECPDTISTHVVAALCCLDAGPAESTEEHAGLPTERPALSFSALTSEDDYRRRFDRLKTWIQAGDCYQANLAVAFRARFNTNPLPLYLHLRTVSRSPFSAFIQAENLSVLSLSPERFLSVNHRQVTTQPIKGTRKRVADASADTKIGNELLSSDKDRAENLMIVDLLRNDLGQVCVTGSVKTPELFALHSFTHVHHLISTVTGELPADVSPLTLLQRCSPGGSITGAPKIRAMQIISELESVPRGMYCGSIFYLGGNKKFDSNICIRTLQSTGSHLYCWGGGGIVADSEAGSEYQECLDKVGALMTALQL